MPKIAFMGAGSTVFAKNILGDCMCSDALRDAHFALYDIDGARLRDSRMMLDNLNEQINDNRTTITAHLGVRSRKTALRQADYAVNAIETDVPARIGGNVLNTGLITNLPRKAVVELACLVNRNGVQGCYLGDLPEQCAAINRTNINTQLLTMEAALEGRRDAIYHAAYLDPHTAAELTLDEIRSMCDDLIEAHGDWLPKYK